MNIAAAMAAIRLDAGSAGVDPVAKYALLVLAARCPDRHTFTVTRSLPALADDMGVSARTALRAVAQLERRGYLQVVHKVGISSTYRVLTPDTVSGVTRDTLSGVPVTYRAVTPDTLSPYKRKTRDKQERSPDDPTPTPSGDPVEKANGGDPTTWQPRRRPHPPECECQGTGWLEHPDTREVTKCDP